jgi:hypothetical protein
MRETARCKVPQVRARLLGANLGALCGWATLATEHNTGSPLKIDRRSGRRPAEIIVSES